jgi:FixJ family two-component response regulator
MGQREKHVFVVDDEAAFLTAIVRLLRVGGYQAVGFASASALVEALPFPHRSCVLVDIISEGCSGLDVPELLGARGESAPVLFMSATNDASTIEAAGRSSAMPCLHKPIEAQDLYDALEATFRAAEQASSKFPQQRKDLS